MNLSDHIWLYMYMLFWHAIFFPNNYFQLDEGLNQAKSRTLDVVEICLNLSAVRQAATNSKAPKAGFNQDACSLPINTWQLEKMTTRPCSNPWVL